MSDDERKSAETASESEEVSTAASEAEEASGAASEDEAKPSAAAVLVDEEAGEEEEEEEEEDMDEFESDDTPTPVEVNGTIFFRLVEGRKYKGGKKMQTFFKVFIDKQRKYQTDHKVKSNEPKYPDKARLLPLKEDQPVTLLRFRVYKKDFVGSSLLGQVVFPIEDLLDGVPRDNWYSMVVKKKKKVDMRGDIHLQLLFLDAADSLTGEAEEIKYPLHSFIRKNKAEVFGKVLKQIVSPREEEYVEPAHEWTIGNVDARGFTALHLASSKGPQYVDPLLKAGADLSAGDEDGKTALMHAAAFGSIEITEMLLAAKADVNQRATDGSSAFHAAAAANEGKVVTVLADHKGDASAQDGNGDTALHIGLRANANASVAALVAAGADIFKQNNSSVAPVKLCMNLDHVEFLTRMAFFEACNVVCEREFDLKKEYKHRITFGKTALEKDWTANPQYCFRTSSPAELKLLFHYEEPIPDDLASPMEKAGFLVVKPPRSDMKEKTYLHDLVAYGTLAPLSIKLEETALDYLPLPYCKNEALPGKWWIVAYTNSDDVQLFERKEWNHSIAVEGEWKGDTAGGCIEHDTWKNNPKFKLVIPAEEEVKVSLLLEQERSAQDLLPFQVLPYKTHIGFYVYDTELDEVFGSVKQMKNAREVSESVTLNGKRFTEYTVVPATFKPGDETKFTLRLFSESDCKLTPE
eukprot:TRINITY_DN789_c0_g1_i2.p1 TRINITY_DN789_c0_g1~~TRINITY_DN789_c0_g1_i2.p1  ORF type:complete len:706 (-),score=287.23 TRINITY_DN789_c0_g1_i2:242-2320(-)